MSKTTMILVAAVTLSGGTRAKSGELLSCEAAPGTELTSDMIAKLGLNDDAVLTLMANGSIAEVDARVAEAASADGGDEIAVLQAKLAAETKRADDAEAKLAAAAKSTGGVAQ